TSCVSQARVSRLTISSISARGSGIFVPPRPEDLLELVGRRDFELVIAAVARPLVRAPALKDRRMAKPRPLHMVVLDLTDSLYAQRLPRQILAGAPAALASGHARRLAAGRFCPFAPGVRLVGALTQRRELERELLADSHRERRGHADVMQRSAVVVQPEQE